MSAAMPSDLEELNRWMKENHLRGYWTREEAPSYEPRPSMEPFLWKWSDVQIALDGAGKYVDLEQAFRRNIGLENPTGRSKTIIMGLQLILPHEKARAHRHTAEAIRFVIEGSSKIWSTVDGEAMIMEPGDLVLTPNWTWHDHVNESAEPVIWVDGLNAAISGHLQLAFREDYPTPQQPVEAPRETSRHLSSFARRQAQTPAASLPGVPYRYAWSDTEKTLTALKGSTEDPCEGLILNYVNPWTGGPTLPTIGCAVQLLRPGLKTRSHRHTSLTYYYCISGGGVARVGGTELHWGKGDFFVVPQWVWHSHENTGGDDALLFSMSDWPMLKPLGFYREEVEGETVSRDRNRWFGS